MDLLYDVAAKQEETETETGTGTRTRAGTKRGVRKNNWRSFAVFLGTA